MAVRFATWALRRARVLESDSPRVDVYSLEGEKWVVRSTEGLESVAHIPSVGLRIELGELYRDVQFDTE